jgi:hypothetical protein
MLTVSGEHDFALTHDTATADHCVGSKAHVSVCARNVHLHTVSVCTLTFLLFYYSSVDWFHYKMFYRIQSVFQLTNMENLKYSTMFFQGCLVNL